MSDDTKTIVVAGGTGLVGGHVLRVLARGKDRVKALVRKPVSSPLPGIGYVQLDFEALCDGQATLPAADEAYICLGSTIKKAGSREAFNRVDRDYVIAVANAAREPAFLLVTQSGTRQAHPGNSAIKTAHRRSGAAANGRPVVRIFCGLACRPGFSAA